MTTHEPNVHRSAFGTLVLEDERLYTTEQTAELLTLSPRQIIDARQAKRLGCVRLSGAAVRHRGDQIRAFIAARSVDAEH